MGIGCSGMSSHVAVVIAWVHERWGLQPTSQPHPTPTNHSSSQPCWPSPQANSAMHQPTTSTQPPPGRASPVSQPTPPNTNRQLPAPSRASPARQPTTPNTNQPTATPNASHVHLEEVWPADVHCFHSDSGHNYGEGPGPKRIEAARSAARRF